MYLFLFGGATEIGWWSVCLFDNIHSASQDLRNVFYRTRRLHNDSSLRVGVHFIPEFFLNLKGGRTQKTKAKLVTERRGNDYRVSPLASSVGGQPDPILGVRASPGAPNGDPDTRRRSVVLSGKSVENGGSSSPHRLRYKFNSSHL